MYSYITPSQLSQPKDSGCAGYLYRLRGKYEDEEKAIVSFIHKNLGEIETRNIRELEEPFYDKFYLFVSEETRLFVRDGVQKVLLYHHLLNTIEWLKADLAKNHPTPRYTLEQARAAIAELWRKDKIKRKWMWRGVVNFCVKTGVTDSYKEARKLINSIIANESGEEKEYLSKDNLRLNKDKMKELEPIEKEMETILTTNCA